MQTFLPSPSFIASAKVLDWKRLGKQRIETKQTLMCLLGEGSLRWANHPAVRMWRGYHASLAQYGIAICQEWQSRGYKDKQLPWFEEKFCVALHQGHDVRKPSWLGNETFHASHRACLLAKEPAWYGQFGWTEEPAHVPGKGEQWPYVWPERGMIT